MRQIEQHREVETGRAQAIAWRRPVDWSLMMLVFLCFAAITLAWSLASVTMARLLPSAWCARIGTPLVTIASRTFLWTMRATGRVRFDLSELDRLRDAGALIIAPNHPSLIDAVLILSRLDQVVCITKASLFDSILLGGGMRLAGYVRNDAPLRTVKEARGCCDTGSHAPRPPAGIPPAPSSPPSFLTRRLAF